MESISLEDEKISLRHFIKIFYKKQSKNVNKYETTQYWYWVKDAKKCRNKEYLLFLNSPWVRFLFGKESGSQETSK